MTLKDGGYQVSDFWASTINPKSSQRPLSPNPRSFFWCLKDIKYDCFGYGVMAKGSNGVGRVCVGC